MYIGHRCGCGHADLNHGPNRNGKTVCKAAAGHPCARRCKDKKGSRVERIVRPGEPLGTESGAGGPRTCDCDPCAALYAELVPADA